MEEGEKRWETPNIVSLKVFLQVSVTQAEHEFGDMGLDSDALFLKSALKTFLKIKLIEVGVHGWHFVLRMKTVQFMKVGNQALL